MWYIVQEMRLEARDSSPECTDSYLRNPVL
jgi:hypothetical protein